MSIDDETDQGRDDRKRELATDIESGRFAPGTALDETEIAAHYGVSRTPIREAIRQLAATGIIEVARRIVAPWSAASTKRPARRHVRRDG